MGIARKTGIVKRFLQRWALPATLVTGAAIGGHYLNNKVDGPKQTPASSLIMPQPIDLKDIQRVNVASLPELGKGPLGQIEKALGSGFSPKAFLIEMGPEEAPVYFISSPTQFNQIVSEGMGYWGEALTGAPDNDLNNQHKFDGLMRGYQAALNENGLAGWRCYSFSKLVDKESEIPQTDLFTRVVHAEKIKEGPNAGKIKVEGIQFKSIEETFSATDADIYIAHSLLKALQLVEDGVWETPSDLDYRKMLDEALARIKGMDVVRLSNQQGGSRYVLTVSDSWGEKDFKGAVTFNPSYAVLNALYDFARYSEGTPDALFWINLRKDAFDAIQASHEWGLRAFENISVEISEDGENVSVEEKDMRLLRNLVYKIRPDKENTMLFKAHGFKVVNPGKDPFFELENAEVIIRQNVWDIERKTFFFMLEQIEKNHVDHFFPDQVELELQNGGQANYKVRIEINANNLDYTENYDAIRVYSELAKDILFNNDEDDPLVPHHLKVTQREIELLGRFMEWEDENEGTRYRLPDKVMAGRHHNAVALFNYFMAAAAHGDEGLFLSYAEAVENYPDISDPLNGRKNGIPQYYNASLSLKLLTEYHSAVTGGSKLTVRLENKLPQLERRERKYHKPLPQGLSIAGIDLYSLDYALNSNIGIADDPLFAYAAERRLRHYTETKNIEDPQTVFLRIDSLLGTGNYNQAAKELLDLVISMPEPEGEVDERILAISTKRLIDILRTLNVPHQQIADLFEWIMEKEGKFFAPNSKKELYLRAAYITELNQVGRTSEALDQGLLFLRSYEKAYGGLSEIERLKEQAAHSALSGSNLRVPLPRKLLLTLAFGEVIYAISNTYTVEKNPEYGFKEKKFKYAEAFALLNLLLGKDNRLLGTLSSIGYGSDRVETQNKEIAQVADRATRLSKEIPKDLKPYLYASVSRILGKMVYDTKTDIELRYFSSEYHKQRFTFDRDNPVREQEKRAYEKAAQNLSMAQAALEIAVKEVLEGQNDPLILNELLKSQIDLNLGQSDLLTEMERIDIEEINLSAEITREEKKEKIKQLDEDYQKQREQLYAQALAITSTVLLRFDAPLKTFFGQTAENTDQQKAANKIVAAQLSADPRNILNVDWIKKTIEIYMNMISHSRKTEATAEALTYCIKISEVYVSNPELRTQFMYDAVMQAGEIIYNTSQIASQIAARQAQGGAAQDVSKEDLEKFKLAMNPYRLRTRALFGALLKGDRPTAKEMEILEDADKQMIEKLLMENTNLKSMFKREPSFKAKALSKYANLLWWGEEDPEIIGEAEKVYQESLKIDPFNIEALVGLSKVCMNQSNNLTNRAEKKEKVLEAYRYAVRALQALGGQEVRQEDIRNVMDAISGIVSNEHVPVPGSAEIRKLIGDRVDITPMDVENILLILRRVNML